MNALLSGYKVKLGTQHGYPSLRSTCSFFCFLTLNSINFKLNSPERSMKTVEKNGDLFYRQTFRWMKVLEQVEKGQLLCISSDDIFFDIIGFTSRLDIKNNCCQITFTCIHVHVFHINRVRGFIVDWNYYRYLIIEYRWKLNICIDTKHSQKRQTKYQLRISIQYHINIEEGYHFIHKNLH